MFVITRCWFFALAFCVFGATFPVKGAEQEQGYLTPPQQALLSELKDGAYMFFGRPDLTLLAFRATEYAGFRFWGMPWLQKRTSLRNILTLVGGAAVLATEAKLIHSDYMATVPDQTRLLSSARSSNPMSWHFDEGRRLIIHPQRGLFTDPNILGDFGERLSRLDIAQLHLLPIMMLGRPMLLIIGQRTNGVVMEPLWYDPLEHYPHKKWVWIETIGVDCYVAPTETPISIFSGFILNGILRHLEGAGHAVENPDTLVSDILTLENNSALKLGIKTAEGKNLYLITNKKHSVMWLVASASQDLLSVLKTAIVDSHLTRIKESAIEGKVIDATISYIFREYWHLLFWLVSATTS